MVHNRPPSAQSEPERQVAASGAQELDLEREINMLRGLRRARKSARGCQIISQQNNLHKQQEACIGAENSLKNIAQQVALKTRTKSAVKFEQLISCPASARLLYVSYNTTTANTWALLNCLLPALPLLLLLLLVASGPPAPLVSAGELATKSLDLGARALRSAAAAAAAKQRQRWVTLAVDDKNSRNQYRPGTRRPGLAGSGSLNVLGQLAGQQSGRWGQLWDGLRNRLGARNSIRVHNAFRDLAWRLLSRLSMPTPVIYELRRQHFYPIEEDALNDLLHNRNTSKTIRGRRQLGIGESAPRVAPSGGGQSSQRRAALDDDDDEDEAADRQVRGLDFILQLFPTPPNQPLPLTD